MRVLVLAVLLALLAPAAASAQTLTEVGAALRQDPVYVDPDAELAGDVDADALREQIRAGGTPIFVAVVPAGVTLEQLHSAVGLAGTYALVSGRSFRAGSDLYRAGPDATAARQANDDVQGSRTSSPAWPTVPTGVGRATRTSPAVRAACSWSSSPSCSSAA